MRDALLRRSWQPPSPVVESAVRNEKILRSLISDKNNDTEGRELGGVDASARAGTKANAPQDYSIDLFEHAFVPGPGCGRWVPWNDMLQHLLDTSLTTVGSDPSFQVQPSSVVIPTYSTAQVAYFIDLLSVRNRRGLLVSGQPGIGKTTDILAGTPAASWPCRSGSFPVLCRPNWSITADVARASSRGQALPTR